MNSKLKKTIIIICMAIISLFVINIVSNGTWIPLGSTYLDAWIVGRENPVQPGTFGLNYTDIDGNDHYDNIFCMNQGADFLGVYHMRVTNHIVIHGSSVLVDYYNEGGPYKDGTTDDGADYWYDSATGMNNGDSVFMRMAYILQNMPHNYLYGADNHWTHNYSDKQKAIYTIISEFKNAIPNKIDFAAPGTSNESYKLDLSAWNTAAKNYYNQNYTGATTATISNKTDTSKVVPSFITVDGTEYIKAGPFKCEYAGNITSVVTKDQDNKDIKPIYATYTGANIANKSTNGADIIKSGTEFFLLLPTDGTVTKINSITINVSKTRKFIIAELWTLEYSTYQSLVSTSSQEQEKKTTASITIPGIELTGDLELTKVNKQSQKPLEGVTFKFQYDKTKKYVKQGANGTISYVDKEEDATPFTTDSEGIIKVKNLLIGTYTAYETSNKNYGYEKKEEGVSVTIKGGTNTPKIENEQKYIKLEGYVWEDIEYQKGSIRNDLYKDGQFDDKDELLGGIKVSLKDKTTGEIVKIQNLETGKKEDAITYTSKEDANKGRYYFEGVPIHSENDINTIILGNYYVEFEYDGIIYKDVLIKNENESYLTKENGSKAIEIAGQSTEPLGRQTFNERYNAVEGTINSESSIAGKMTNANGAEGENITYTRNKYTENEKEVWRTEFNNTLEDGTYNITATTKESGYNIGSQFDWGTETIKNINLGLYEREKPDLAIQKDVQNVRLDINGYSHTYNYLTNLGDTTTAENRYNDLAVKFPNASQTYTRTIYKSDLTYSNSSDKDKNLKVYITYKIQVKNQSSNINSSYTLADYFENKFDTNVEIGTGIEKGKVTGTDKFKEIEVDSKTYEKEGYNKLTINYKDEKENQVLAGKTNDIYVQFQLKETEINNILNGELTLNNVTEINSYASYDSEGKAYAGVDKNSAAGDIDLAEVLKEKKDITTKSFEDDMDIAPGMGLKLGDNREITGAVFEDEATLEGTGNVRQGSGIYENGENTIGGVEVTLQEKANVGGKTYKTATVEETGTYAIKKEEDKDITTLIPEIYNEANKNSYIETNVEIEKGNFYIKGYIPGEYSLTYTWGNDEYPVQDYKGTIFNQDAHKDKNWYREKDENAIRYSDATDDYETRQNIDSEIRKVENGEQVGYTINTMNSQTPSMQLGIEHQHNYQTDISTESKGDEEGKITYTYEVNNVDFGIIERARQQIEIDKRVSNVKLTLANGQVLIDTNINEDGTYDAASSFTYIKPQNSEDKGTVKIEIDNEMIQGSTLDVTYAIKVNNLSEKDYNNEAFYLYGTIPANDNDIVKIAATEVYDFLDDQFGTIEQEDWKLLSYDEYVSSTSNIITPAEMSTLSEKVIETLKEATTINGTWYEAGTQIIREKNKTIYTSEVIETYEDWKKETVEKRKQSIMDENSKILATEKLSKQLAPNSNTEVTINASKVLTSTDDINLNNRAEIYKISSNGGRTKLKAGTGWEDGSEEITIIPPTGENQNYILYIITGTVALLVIAGGVVLIKKKAL